MKLTCFTFTNFYLTSFSNFCCASLISFPFPTCLKDFFKPVKLTCLKFTNFNLTSFSNFFCARSISFQTCLKSSKKLSISQYFSSFLCIKMLWFNEFFLFVSFQNWRMSPKSQISWPWCPICHNCTTVFVGKFQQVRPPRPGPIWKVYPKKNRPWVKWWLKRLPENDDPGKIFK